MVTLRIPALRDRTEDIPDLVSYFTGEFGADEPPFDAQTLRNLQRHSWPGNVRELRNYVEATIAMGEQPEPPPEGAPAGSDLVTAVLPMTYKDARAKVLSEFEKRFLAHWLEQSEGNVAATARATEMDRSHLFQLLKKHKLREK